MVQAKGVRPNKGGDGGMTSAQLMAAADQLGPVALDAASITDEHGFADGNLLSDWARRAVPAPPRVVCQRALFALAVPNLWSALLQAGEHVWLRYRDTTANPVVHRSFPAELNPSSELAAVVAVVEGKEVAAALIRQVEALLPPAEDVLGVEALQGDRSGVAVRLRREDDRFESRSRQEVLAWALGLDDPVTESVEPDAVTIACFGDHDQVVRALVTADSWQRRAAVRSELFAHLDEVALEHAPAAPTWDAFTDALDNAGIVWEGDDRQEDPCGDRATIDRIDLGEGVAHRFLMWEFPYNDEPSGWLGDCAPSTQARFLRALEWAQRHPDKWSPHLIQHPMAKRQPWGPQVDW
jgi:hypothetical protein